MNEDRFYFDTSALLPYYREEPASSQIQIMLSGVRPPILLSDLSKVEMASAIARWVRMKEIEEAQAALIENAFNQDASTGLYRVLPLTMIHYQQAEKWISTRKAALRTLDALHIACCWSFQATLITCDSIMREAASIFGLNCLLISPNGPTAFTQKMTET